MQSSSPHPHLRLSYGELDCKVQLVQFHLKSGLVQTSRPQSNRKSAESRVACCQFDNFFGTHRHIPNIFNLKTIFYQKYHTAKAPSNLFHFSQKYKHFLIFIDKKLFVEKLRLHASIVLRDSESCTS